MSVNTKTVAGRRELHFNSLDDVLADLNQLDGKPLTALGNWSVGQILFHLSIPMNGAIDGLELGIPWYYRLVGRLFKRVMLNGKMPAGFKLPQGAAEKLVPPPTSDAEGFDALRKAVARFKRETHRQPHPFFGKLSIEDYDKIMCRHCELHLSFIQFA